MSDSAMSATRVDRVVQALVVAGFILVLGLGALLPVYSDEIGWRLQERAWIDGVDKAYSDLCGPASLAAPPWFMMPVRWFSASANQMLANPLFVRMEGVACAIAWVALVWVLIARLTTDRTRRLSVRTLVFALLGMGTLPYLLVMSRPEQPLLLALTLMLLIALSRPGGAAVTAVKAAGIVLLAGVAMSYHLKGVAYAPVALACLAVCANGRATIAPRLVAAGALLAAMAASASYWISRFQCPGDALMATKMGEENLASALSAGVAWPAVLLQAVKGVSPMNYVLLAVPSNTPMSAWVPEKLFPDLVPPIFTVALWLPWAAAILMAAIMLTRFVWRERMGALREPRVLLALAIMACVMVWGASQVNRNVYEAGHVLPMLALFVALCLTLPAAWPGWLTRPVGWLIAVAAVVALSSQVVLVRFTAQPLLAATQIPGALPKQEFSVSLAGYGTVRTDIAKAMALAGIAADSRQPGLMIDDVTYLALQRHPLPFHRLGVTEAWNIGIDNPAAYLVSRNSAGVVASCRHLPMEMELAAVTSGEICALSPAMLKELAAPPPSLWGDE
ncbi:MAG: hypothetical protein ABIQ81_06570 [Novosphingobium sp.]